MQVSWFLSPPAHRRPVVLLIFKQQHFIVTNSVIVNFQSNLLQLTIIWPEPWKNIEDYQTFYCWMWVVERIESFIILAILHQSVQRVCWAHLLVVGPRQHCSFRKTDAAVASRWQRCVRFDQLETWISDLPLQRQIRNRFTINQLLNCKYKIVKIIVNNGPTLQVEPLPAGEIGTPRSSCSKTPSAFES